MRKSLLTVFICLKLELNAILLTSQPPYCIQVQGKNKAYEVHALRWKNIKKVRLEKFQLGPFLLA